MSLTDKRSFVSYCKFHSQNCSAETWTNFDD